MAHSVRKITLTASVFLLALTSAGLFAAYYTKNVINEVFRLNEERKAEGYYLSEFEFEMLGIAYYLDRWQFVKGLSNLKSIHKRLKTTNGLTRTPQFGSDKEELAFYLDMQNPISGAFYANDSDHMFTFIAGTANMIDVVADLSRKTDTPFRLQHPLIFLDEINTPDKLVTFLDDISRVGWIGARFKTPYVTIAELGVLVEQSERFDLYSFSAEWKHAFYQWFHSNQDEETGLWGPRLRGSDEHLNGGDLGDSEKVIKMFVDRHGHDIRPDFPLNHRNRIFSSTLDRLSAPMPEDLHESHRWILAKNRGIRLLTRYLWRTASFEERESARKIIKDYIVLLFEQYYVESEGAFSLYPNAGHADLDGTGEALGMLAEIGAFSTRTQNKLWRESSEGVVDLGRYEVSRIDRDDLGLILSKSGTNSFRLYGEVPSGDHAEKIEGVFYVEDTGVQDILELLPKLNKWLETTDQEIGNWVTREFVHDQLSVAHIRSIPVFREIPLTSANDILLSSSRLVVIGFDVAQVPRYKILYTLKTPHQRHLLQKNQPDSPLRVRP